MNGRQRVLGLIEGGEVDRTPLMPITMMFAADHIGARYRDYVTDHQVLARAQIETAMHHSFDHVSVISDPAREAADLGAEIAFFDDQPPAVVGARSLLTDKVKLASLEPADPLGGGRMTDRVEGVQKLVRDAGREKLVEGWVEGPCATGANLRGINTLMLDFSDDPAFVHDLFEFGLEQALRFARAQIDAGADLIGVGDAAASLVGPARYREFVLPYEQRLVEGIHAMGALARVHICGRTGKLLPDMASLGADILDLDWMVSMAEARAHSGPEQVLLGNIDPVAVLRNGTPSEIDEALTGCRRDAGSRYIAGAGCEVVHDTPEANIQAMIDFATAHVPGTSKGAASRAATAGGFV